METATENQIDTTEAITISPDIILGKKGAAKILISCEQGIKNFVKQIAKEDNHLPFSETGVLIHYLTQGIERDFNRTWDSPPISIRKKETGLEKAVSKGKRVLTKKAKNELLERMNITYYQQDIVDGKITMEEAQSKIAEAFNQKLELENTGLYLSPKKTEGVSLFNDQKLVEEAAEGRKEVFKLMSKNDISVVIPNFLDNFDLNNKTKKEAAKNPWASTSNINSLIKEKEKEGYKTKGVHLVKITKSGQMKPRYICLVFIDKNDSICLFLRAGDMEILIQE